MCIAELKVLIVEYFELPRGTTLEMRYETYNEQIINGARKKRIVYLSDDDILDDIQRVSKDGLVTELTLDDIKLFHKRPAGTVIKNDVSCDSEFMLRTMPKVGAAIREKMPWVPREQPIYLQMDNAGGHGTKAAVGEYTQHLLDRHNIIIIHQSPRSPEVNALDLGLWRSLQSGVGKLHRDKRADPNIIATSVEQAWADLPSQTVANVFGRIPTVLELIAEDGGGNAKVEERRGELANAPDVG